MFYIKRQHRSVWNYKFQYSTVENQISVDTSWLEEVVYTHNQRGQEYLEEMRRQNYACSLRLSNTWLCKKFEKLELKSSSYSSNHTI